MYTLIKLIEVNRVINFEKYVNAFFRAQLNITFLCSFQLVLGKQNNERENRRTVIDLNI